MDSILIRTIAMKATGLMTSNMDLLKKQKINSYLKDTFKRTIKNKELLYILMVTYTKENI